MCHEILIDDQSIDRQCQLAAVMPGGFVTRADYFLDGRGSEIVAETADDTCLCPVDIEATARRNNFDCVMLRPGKFRFVPTRSA